MIATTIEQSKRLLDCGLDPKTADMCYVKQDAITRDDKEACALYMFAVLKSQAHTYYMTGDSEVWDEVADFVPYTYKWKDMQMVSYEMKDGDIPAWSLSALLQHLASKNRFPLITVNDFGFFAVCYEYWPDDLTRVECCAESASLIDACCDVIEEMSKQKLL